jgi:hypothetical protein
MSTAWFPSEERGVRGEVYMRVKAALLAIAIEFAIAIAAVPLASTVSRGGVTAPRSTSAQATGVTAASPPASAIDVPPGPNLLSNGDFATGSGKAPDNWRTSGWNESPAYTSYDWLHAAGSEPELVVTNLQPNDARWLQTLSLGPGWYYIGAEVRTEGVPPNASGGSVSLDEDSVNSPDLHGAPDWQRVGLYLKVGAHGADIDVALRLGGFSNLNTGRAFFRKARVVKLDALPANAAPVFDLTAVRRSAVAPPIGKPWTLVAAFMLLAVMAVAGWTIYGAEDSAPAPAPIKTQPPPSLSRGERRRRKDSARRRR